MTAWEHDTDVSLELAPSPRLRPSDGEEEGQQAGLAASGFVVAHLRCCLGGG